MSYMVYYTIFLFCQIKIYTEEFMLNKINLPYPFDVLEPYYSKETLLLHYDILYSGYVDNTNKR